MTTSAPRADSAQPRTSATATEPNQPVSSGNAGSGEPTIGALVQQASTHLSAMVHGEIELAKAELSASFKNAGTGAGFYIGAAVALFFATMFLLIAAAEGLVALGVPRSGRLPHRVRVSRLGSGNPGAAGHAAGQEGQGTGAHHFGDQGDRRVPSEPNPIHIVTR